MCQVGWLPEQGWAMTGLPGVLSCGCDSLGEAGGGQQAELPAGAGQGAALPSGLEFSAGFHSPADGAGISI